jgi:hypothetical protein
MSTKEDQLRPRTPDLLDAFAPDCGLAVWMGQVCQRADDVPGILAAPRVMVAGEAPQHGGDVCRDRLHAGEG